MTGKRVRCGFLLAPVLALWAGSSAPLDGALVKYHLGKLCERSSRIVRGQVLSVNSYWGRLGELGPVILTDVTIEVHEALKGRTEDKRITVQLLGGRIGERWQWCAESPTYTVGEEVLVFARRWNGALWTTGWIQGKYRLVKNASGARVIGARAGLPLRSGENFRAVKDKVKTLVLLSQTSEVQAAGGAQRSAARTSGVPSPSSPKANSESARKAPGGAR